MVLTTVLIKYFAVFKQTSKRTSIHGGRITSEHVSRRFDSNILLILKTISRVTHMGGDHSQVNTCEDDSIPMFCSVTTNFYSCSYTWRSDEK